MTQDQRTDRMYQSGQPLFHHHPLPAEIPDRILNDTTRLMCAGTYLDPNYARAVIRELVEHEHRAVVPSVGFDLGPVLRHGFRARRLELQRNAALTGLVTL